MKITVDLGEHSAGDAKLIPDNSARVLKNLVRKNGQLVRRKGKDDANSGLSKAIDRLGTVSEIWSWKPALRIDGRGDLYYFVLYDDNTAELFKQDDGGWSGANLNITFPTNSSVTIFASPDALLISDGISSPAKIYLKSDNTINKDNLGLLAPSFKPYLFTAVYTDEEDQQRFSEVGFVRVAVTLVDKNGIESNPSQISNAYNGQKFKYVDEVQTNYIASINVRNIVINDENIESVNIYTETTKFSEGEDTSVFSYASNYPVNQGDNEFILYASGTETTLLSYENDVLKVSDNISKAGDIIVSATDDQLYKNEGLFRYLQGINLKNVNNQTIMDKPIRLRLYNGESNVSSSPNQEILNFNVTDFFDDGYEDINLNYIRLYDDDLSTLLKVFIVSRDSDDQYMEIMFTTTMVAGSTKKLFLAFTPIGSRTDYSGGRYTVVDGRFSDDADTAGGLFRRVDVFNADTEIICWCDDTLIDGEALGRINLADTEVNPGAVSENLYPPANAVNTMPYLQAKSDININPYTNNRNYLVFDFAGEITPYTFYMSARFDVMLRREVTDITLNMFRTANDEDGTPQRVTVYFNYDVYENEIYFNVITNEGGTYRFEGTLPFETYIHEINDNDFVLPIFALWSVKINPNDHNDQTHTLYVMPLYNNGDSYVFTAQIDNVDGESEIDAVWYGSVRRGSSLFDFENIGVTGAVFQSNVNLELTDNNTEAVRNMANAMPLYLTAPIGRKFEDGSAEENSNFSLADQVDFDNLGNYFNYIIRWTDKSGENFSDLNYHKADNACTAIIPVRGFYNNQYAPTLLIFTENSITRLIIDDETNQKAGANPMVGEQSGYGSGDRKYIAKYGDIVFWYSEAKNHCYMYNGESIENISLGKVEFTAVSRIFINPAERQLIVVEKDKQYIYSLEYNEWYSSTGLEITSSTTIEDGKSLINIPNALNPNVLYEYPSADDTTEETELKTKQYSVKGYLIDRAMVDAEGSDMDLAIDTEYRGNANTTQYNGFSRYTSYGITYRAEFLFFTLTGINNFTSISADIRRF